MGRISGISTKQNSGASQVTVASSPTYKPFGPLSGLTFGNGVVLSSTYDQDYQLTGVAAASGGTTIQNLTNGFDPSGNITSITDNLTSARSQTVTYDNLNRIKTAGGIYGAQTYAYDGVGNRSSLAVGSTTSSYTYASNANQITAITNTATPPSTATGSYLYNAFRQRVQKVAGGSTTQFAYDQAGRLIAEANGSGAVQKEYIWLDDMPVAMVNSTGTLPVLYFIHTDQLGTPQKLTDGSMNVVWDGVFDPFGKAASGASLAFTNLRFPGQYFDAEDALNQNWNRDYDQEVGRYIQSDPTGLKGGVNTYVYVRSNPLKLSDREGLASECDKPDCRAVKNKCIEQCSSTLPTKDYGFTFWNCVNRCMTAAGCNPGGPEPIPESVPQSVPRDSRSPSLRPNPLWLLPLLLPFPGNPLYGGL